MKIGIMQPYFFPYIGYWQLINAVDKYVVYDDVNYIKNGWINRNNILINKQKHLITVPLEGASSFKSINQISISHNKKQKEKLLKSVQMSYQKAPFFNLIYPIIEKTVMYEDLLISSAIIFSIKEINKYLDIDTEILISSEIEKDNTLHGQDKVINIVKALRGTEYYNAIGGQELYNKEDFAIAGIDLKFLKTGNIRYKQFNNEFVPNLSIIDILMFNSPEKVKPMLGEYELV